MIIKEAPIWTVQIIDEDEVRGTESKPERLESQYRMIVVVGGPGTGKTSLVNNLMRVTGWETDSAVSNYVRSRAAQLGVSVREFGEMMTDEEHLELDRRVSERMHDPNTVDLIVEGRMAGWSARDLQGQALRVLLRARTGTRLARWRKQGREESRSDFERRKKDELVRYKRLTGGVNVFDKRQSFYDLVIRTDDLSEEYVAAVVLHFLENPIPKGERKEIGNMEQVGKLIKDTTQAEALFQSLKGMGNGKAA